MAVFRENGVYNLIFIFKTHPKRTSMRETASFDVFYMKINFGGLGCSLFEESKNEHFRSYISPIWGEKNLVGSAQNIHDVISHANFGDDIV